MNLPNFFTLTRIFLIPIFMALLLSKGSFNHYWAAFIFLTAALTDGLDGYLARLHRQVTNLGKFLDPLADKLLVIAALVCLVDLGSISSWMAMAFIAREIAVTGLRLIGIKSGRDINPSIWGKTKTWFQVIALLLLILKPSFYNYFAGYYLKVVDAFLFVALFFTYFSAWLYFKDNLGVLIGKRNQNN